MIYSRLVLIHELLADDGSLYLHLGPNVSHSVKLLCDEIFGAAAFRNEIVWRRTSAHSRLRRYRSSAACRHMERSEVVFALEIGGLVVTVGE
jgi:hypothetical protein